MNKHAEKYKRLKEKYSDDILLYQIGIFYKIMFKDAEKAAKVTGLKLLMSGEASEPITVCGFPASGMDKYIGKMVRAGFSVAICSQKKDEDGQIQREVSEVVKVTKGVQ